MSFNDFVQKYKLKNQATSNIKIQQVISSIGLVNIKIYLTDGSLESAIGFVNYILIKKPIRYYKQTKIILIHIVLFLLKSHLNLF